MHQRRRDKGGSNCHLFIAPKLMCAMLVQWDDRICYSNIMSFTPTFIPAKPVVACLNFTRPGCHRYVLTRDSEKLLVSPLRLLSSDQQPQSTAQSTSVVGVL